ncbi:hypothetical protein BDV98DRAFT_406879 [Pterulicium gracile]|uniref:Uncharacterized protein n=1 Tax=Pterulicium gracile TaxID=1884261 RepID=A0A5C3QMU6_9AGAR|nr:hypothetical protein BDV98DRAFT_406879 [Pterula gracilis]
MWFLTADRRRSLFLGPTQLPSCLGFLLLYVLHELPTSSPKNPPCHHLPILHIDAHDHHDVYAYCRASPFLGPQLRLTTSTSQPYITQFLDYIVFQGAIALHFLPRRDDPNENSYAACSFTGAPLYTSNVLSAYLIFWHLAILTFTSTSSRYALTLPRQEGAVASSCVIHDNGLLFITLLPDARQIYTSSTPIYFPLHLSSPILPRSCSRT